MYAELQCKTNFSFLRGASHPEELIETAASVGLAALAITDNDGVYGIPKAYWACRKHSNLKLIVGADIRLLDHPRITLLAKDRAAYATLCRLITRCHQDRDKTDPGISLKNFCQQIPESSGLVALPAEASNYKMLKDLFDKDLYIPLGRFLDGYDQFRTMCAMKISEEFQLPIVATNDVHFHKKNRRKLQDAMTAVREGTSLERAGFRLYSNGERYLKSAFQMRQLFKDMPEAVTRTLEVAEKCSFCPSELRYRYPSEWIPRAHSAQSYLEELTWSGATQRYPRGTPDAVKAQIHHELDLINKMQYADYFLTIYDIVDFANKKDILCQGRGSAANSVVCYCLGITVIDPVRMNLLFERFISAERDEPPDIDVDFEHERREEVIQYIYEKYGRHRAAMVSAVVTYQKRSAFRELGKALGLEVGTLSAKALQKEFDHIPATMEVPSRRELIEELSSEMKGFPRHLSIHSGGFTLSADPIIDIVPVEPARMEGRTIIQWDKYDLDYLGLLKIDVLSLGMLSALQKTLKATGLKLHEIPADDKRTYAMIQKADTVGTFQIESRAQMSMLGRLQPRNFYDLVIEVAIVRPGPIVGKMVHPYLKRRRGEEVVYYPHPKIKKILQKTLGIPLFQEQVMSIAIELGGFSPGEADELRRAIGAWRSEDSISEMGKKLMRGLVKNGLSIDYAKRIFEQIQGFSKYGFPESHAASFAILAYASCYLKCHYPSEFACSLINSQPMGFYANHTLIDDAKRHGVEVYPLDPNTSHWDCTLEKSGFRLGWRVVKGISKFEVESIMSARPFANLFDFLGRTRMRKNILVRLAMGGALEVFGEDRRTTLWNILSYHVKKSQSQLDLFSSYHQDTAETQFADLDLFGEIQEDYMAMSLSHRGHPMGALRSQGALPLMSTAKARSLPPGSWIRLSGLLLVRQRPSTAKGMTFSTLEDEQGFLDLALKPDVYERYKDVFLFNCFVTVSGRIQRDGHSVSLLVKKVESLWDDSDNQLNIEPTQYFF